jgi:hypothetical protein
MSTAPLIVATDGSAPHCTIGAAVADAPPGGCVLVRPGTYRETVFLTQPIEIRGDGPREEIILESSDADCCIHARSSSALVRGLTLVGRCPPKPPGDLSDSTVFVGDGTCTVEDCSITTSHDVACAGVEGAATLAVFRRCLLHDPGFQGLWLGRHARALMEDCELVRCKRDGIVIDDGGDLVLRRCCIHSGNDSGVWARYNGKALIEDCDIYDNAHACICSCKNSKVRAVRCQLRRSRQSGVWVWEQGEATLEQCVIEANDYSGVAVRDAGSAVVIKRCRMLNNKQWGAHLDRGCRAVIGYCELVGNANGSWNIESSCKVARRNNRE